MTTSGGPGPWVEWVDGELARIEAAGQWRAPRPLDSGRPATSMADGTQVVEFASNDYLGLSQHPAVVAAAHEALDRFGAGSGAARLVVGARPVHDELEAALAAWKGTDRAVLFPTGFAANLGVLGVLADRDTLVVSDELNHASIIDGCRLARAEVAIARHADPTHVAELLAGAGARRAIVVTDTVFSMDGDLAPIEDLLEVCAATGALLVVDEAHAVLGPEVRAHPDVTIVRVGTSSKTLGSLGGFVAASGAICDLLVNRARPYIFTTASTPADTAAALAAVGVLRSDEGATLVDHLRALVERVRPGHPSPIVPVVIGDERDAVAASAELLAQGLLVPAIRPPTVAPGTSRLRVALSAAHTVEQVDHLAAALAQVTARRS